MNKKLIAKLLLLKFSLTINATVDEQLVEAVLKKNAALVKNLLQKGANLYTRVQKGLTPLHLAINVPESPCSPVSFNFDTVNNHIKSNKKESRKSQVIGILINKVNNPNKLEFYINSKDYFGYNALFYALTNNDTTTAKKLVDLGANVNCIYENTTIKEQKYPNLTPLMIACLYENTELIKVLLKANANPAVTFNLENQLVFKCRTTSNSMYSYNALKLTYNTNNILAFRTLLKYGISSKDIINSNSYFASDDSNNKLKQLFNILYRLTSFKTTGELENILESVSQDEMHTVFKFISNNQDIIKKVLDLNTTYSEILNTLTFYLKLKQNNINDQKELFNIINKTHVFYNNIVNTKIKNDIYKTAKKFYELYMFNMLG